MSKDDYIRIRCTRQQKEFAKKLSKDEGFTLTELVITLLLKEGECYSESRENNEK